MITLAIVVGSLRKDSFNKRLVTAMEKIGSDLFVFNYVNVQAIPLYNQDDEARIPEGVTAAKSLVAASDGVLIATPEYNRSFPGVLKNTLDWLSRPYGESVWIGKPLGIVGVSPSPVGTASAQAELRSLSVVLGMMPLCPPEIYISGDDALFTPGGDIANEGTRKFLRGYLETLAAWVAGRKK